MLGLYSTSSLLQWYCLPLPLQSFQCCPSLTLCRHSNALFLLQQPPLSSCCGTVLFQQSKRKQHLGTTWFPSHSAFRCKEPTTRTRIATIAPFLDAHQINCKQTSFCYTCHLPNNTFITISKHAGHQLYFSLFYATKNLNIFAHFITILVDFVFHIDSINWNWHFCVSVSNTYHCSDYRRLIMRLLDSASFPKRVTAFVSSKFTVIASCWLRTASPRVSFMISAFA